jgi:O-antigen ligase
MFLTCPVHPAIMSGWSPPSLPRALLVGTAVVWLVLLAYAILIQGRILLGVLPGLGLVVLYVLWRFLVALEAIADGVHRIADQGESD